MQSLNKSSTHSNFNNQAEAAVNTTDKTKINNQTKGQHGHGAMITEDFIGSESSEEEKTLIRKQNKKNVLKDNPYGDVCAKDQDSDRRRRN